MCKGLATLPATCLKSAKDIKHKISFLLQKSEPPAAEQKQVREKAAAPSGGAKRVPTVSEVEKWKESFSHVMSSETGRAVFTSFLKSEFSQENMDFWMACEDYRKTPPSKLAARARKIYQQYVEADTANEVNLDAAVREETRRSVDGAGPRCFDEAQKAVYALMEKDSYRRFLNSKLVQELGGSFQQENMEKKNCSCSENSRHVAGGA